MGKDNARRGVLRLMPWGQGWREMAPAIDARMYEGMALAAAAEAAARGQIPPRSCRYIPRDEIQIVGNHYINVGRCSRVAYLEEKDTT